MRQFRITVSPHPPLDVRGAAIVSSAPTVGVENVRAAQVSDLYFIRGDLSDAQINELCTSVLFDPAAHDIRWTEESASTATDDCAAELAFLPAVMDPLALQLPHAPQQIGLPPIDVAT